MDSARRRAWVLALAVGVAACSGGGDDGGDGGGEVASTTAGGSSFEERNAVTELSMAATGISLVANDISLRALQGGAGGADYCRTQAPGELAPHRTTLEAASDEEVRKRADAALGALDTVVEACASDDDPAALQQAIQRYNTSFQRLRQRLDQLLAAGGGGG